MFTTKSNATFNNGLFNAGKIDGMHEQTKRLYEAALLLQRTEGQSEVAKLLNISPQRLNNWESRGMSAQGRIDAQRIIGCSATWLETGDGDMEDHGSSPFSRAATFPEERAVILENSKNGIAVSYSQPESGDIVIRQFDAVGSMGGGVLLRDQPGVIQSWHVTPEWIQKNVKHHTGAQNLCIVTGFGDSMRPMYEPGDPLLVDTGVKAVEFDAIYFFRVDGEGFIKRLQRIPGEGIRAISENKGYESWTIKPGMDFEVFGRVLKAWKSEDY